ncbi:hypothetical protein A3D88_01975 [Candidatus Peribacteria bacterium RIFCSPHIGHO2_02_FULL_52_16]|nr:MAG: hypothetical protein A2706_05170 [Candidatus Peribacteria bacterium RIFCSPHIGHO2_01_FULL_51_35]OGJ61154.1 MAG: hypothetical protein A3D88_01975 [Candidatus Peribacteria bacterium RIFCSPHIGHO2_02_FULL_52_16]
MTDFSKLIGQHKNLSEDAQKQAGKAISGAMKPEHYEFLKLIAKLIQENKIDVYRPETFFTDAYQKLDAAKKAKVDLATVNIADLLRHTADFYLSKQTPDESPHLMTMIDQLVAMKQRVEKQYGDVYKF